MASAELGDSYFAYCVTYLLPCMCRFLATSQRKYSHTLYNI